MEINHDKLQFLKNVSKYYAKHTQDADDICSEVIMKLLRVEDITIKNFYTYASTTVKHTMYNYYRLSDNSRVTSVFDIFEDTKLRYTPGYELTGPLYDAIETLPEKQREIIEYTLKDFKPMEIQEVTGYNLDTIRANKRHALKKLRKQLTNVY